MSSKPVVQSHHAVYPSPEHPEQECVVRVRKCEHLLLTRQSWYCRKTLSKGYVKAQKIWLALNEDRAEEV